MSQAVLDFLLQRRSVKPVMMTAPGPDEQQLATILKAATRVPDHKKVEPWRFVVFQGDARAQFGKALAAACLAEEKETPSPVRLDIERNRFTSVPLVIAVISRVTPTPGAPEWEQILSCGAVCMNLSLAANACGFSSNWLTGWYTYSPGIRAHLQLGDNERIAGFIHIGTAKATPEDRERPDLGKVVQYYGSK